MSKSTTLSMQVPARSQAEKPDLPTAIRQIIEQKGAFRRVNAQALALEEAAVESSQDSDLVRGDGETTTTDVDEPPQARLEKLWKGREEMLQSLDRAQNDVLTALDFLSLLLSKQSVPAQGSMSPALKQAVPVGSLDARIVQSGALSVALNKRLATTSQGWRCQAFESAFGKLSLASSTLQSEAAHESKFWEQVANLRQQGWAVSRHPRDAKAIGVHFGFAEGAPQFRNRGFALLRQDDNGDVYLDPTAVPKKNMAVSVHILRQGMATGIHTPLTTLKEVNVSASQQILDARNALFEEELFYEISREARSIANYGLLTRAKTIQFDVLGEYQVRFALGEVSEESQVPTKNEHDSRLAQFISLSIRRNLIKAHEANRLRRSQTPAPMSSRSNSVPEYVVLKPIIAFLRHQAAVKELIAAVEKLTLSLTQAGEETKVRIGEEPTILSETGVAQLDRPPSDLAAPKQTILHLTLPSKRVFVVTVSSLLAAPIYGTQFQTPDIDYGFIRLKSATYDNPQGMESALCRVLSLDLMSKVLIEHSSASWQVSQPHNGELALLNSGQPVGRLRISVGASGLVLKFLLLSNSEKARKLGWMWSADGLSQIGPVGDLVKDGGGQLSFAHIIAEVSKLGG